MRAPLWVRGGTAALALLFILPSRLPSLPAEAEITVEIDLASPGKRIRPLHGINKGPLAAGGQVDVSAGLRELSVPFIRLHDCHWPNPDVVDIHAVFPDMRAEPDLEESYDFRLTDEYIAAARATGAQIIFRLGESIEHTSVKRFVHPPADIDRWARVAVGIIRHYNEGWARGFHYGVRYWEIWNEPDNRPYCWTGTDEQYFRLYAAAARRIKTAFPGLKVGGPAVGNTGKLTGRELEPSAFVIGFLDYCRRERVPLDFFSWHCYSADPRALKSRASGVRRTLDERGFAKTESHLTEWNYLPDGDWAGLSKTAPPDTRQRFYERIAGAEGAAFIAASLIELQDAPVDVCCLFHGETGGFGLFSENGVPYKVWYAVKAFAELASAGRSIPVRGSNLAGVRAAASVAANGASTVLLSKTGNGEARVRLALNGADTGSYEILKVDGSHSLEPVTTGTRIERGGAIPVGLEGPSIALIRYHPANTSGSSAVNHPRPTFASSGQARCAGFTDSAAETR